MKTNGLRGEVIRISTVISKTAIRMAEVTEGEAEVNVSMEAAASSMKTVTEQKAEVAAEWETGKTTAPTVMETMADQQSSAG